MCDERDAKISERDLANFFDDVVVLGGDKIVEMLDRNATPIKIGDRVLYASNNHDFGYGTVLFTAGPFCAVEFDNYCDELNDAGGNGKPGHCWYTYPSFLEIAGEQETKISENDLWNFLFKE